MLTMRTQPRVSDILTAILHMPLYCGLTLLTMLFLTAMHRGSSALTVQIDHRVRKRSCPDLDLARFEECKTEINAKEGHLQLPVTYCPTACLLHSPMRETVPYSQHVWYA